VYFNWPSHNGSTEPRRLTQGLLSGLLLAIPIWMGIGIGVITVILHRRFTTAEVLMLGLAAAFEILFMHHAWHELGWRFGLRSWAGLKRVALVSGLAVAYLHYYFWDVKTQIAMLPTVTVFVPVHQFS